jgi:hypothetical protein
MPAANAALAATRLAGITLMLARRSFLAVDTHDGTCISLVTFTSAVQ